MDMNEGGERVTIGGVCTLYMLDCLPSDPEIYLSVLQSESLSGWEHFDFGARFFASFSRKKIILLDFPAERQVRAFWTHSYVVSDVSSSPLSSFEI